MPFLGGSLAFERYNISGFENSTFTDEHIELIQSRVAGNVQTDSTENVHVGFLGGKHLFDQKFDLEKNVISDALHVGVRIDTNQIPSAIRQAWLEIELAALAAESPSGVPSKAQRKEAKESVEQRCESEAATGKYRRMKQAPLLWDYHNETLYFGGSAGPAAEHCIGLIERVFEVEALRNSAGKIAQAWATENEQVSELYDVRPTNFVPELPHGDVAWANEHTQTPDFLGNEFLLWLWWTLETESDTLQLHDESEVTVMLNKTLTLECPRGESGKETISAECPTKLPEAMQAIRSGKLPRKTGMTLVRDGQQIDLVLQAESFAVSGAKIHFDDEDEFEIEDRIDSIRRISETIDLMLETFCARRVTKAWNKDVKKIRNWFETNTGQSKAAA